MCFIYLSLSFYCVIHYTMSGIGKARGASIGDSSDELRTRALAILARIIAKYIIRKTMTEKQSSNNSLSLPNSHSLDDTKLDKNQGSN